MSEPKLRKSLLIGNGLNRLTGLHNSWSQVLTDLASWAGCRRLVDPDLLKHKPFSLVYEEIAISSCRNGAVNELVLKNEVARRIDKFLPNDYHKRLVESVSKHLITTNYDYTLERASGLPNEKANLKSESRYNVFRRRRVGDKYIWHIHGESDVPNSITLGHEQYAGQLQKLRAYLTANRRTRSKLKSPFKMGKWEFDNGERLVYSWVDVFLRDEVHIIGLSLDYTEIDLWWVLAYKERLQRMKGYNVGKTIYYDTKPQNPDLEKAKAKHSILKSFGVEPRMYNKHVELYEDVLYRLGAR